MCFGDFLWANISVAVFKIVENCAKHCEEAIKARAIDVSSCKKFDREFCYRYDYYCHCYYFVITILLSLLLLLFYSSLDEGYRMILSVRKIWPLLELLAKITQVLASLLMLAIFLQLLAYPDTR